MAQRVLVANSLIVGALAISPAAFWTSRWAPIAMLGAGLLISIAWFLITMYGWWVMRRHAVVASDFVASHYKLLPNPFADPTYHRSSLRIHLLALSMIGIFMLIYLGLGYIRPRPRGRPCPLASLDRIPCRQYLLHGG